MEKFKFQTFFSILMLIMHGLYAQYQGQVNIDPADVNYEQTDGWDIATIEGCYMETDVGKPLSILKHLLIAINKGSVVTIIKVLNILQLEFSGFYNKKK